VFGESVLNDAVGMVLFDVIKGFVLGHRAITGSNIVLGKTSV
jgi:NhaP-type Na+/H+ or K+/H+ antiporter